VRRGGEAGAKRRQRSARRPPLMHSHAAQWRSVIGRANLRILLPPSIFIFLHFLAFSAAARMLAGYGVSLLAGTGCHGCCEEIDGNSSVGLF
jgi:hypothetical protein